MKRDRQDAAQVDVFRYSLVRDAERLSGEPGFELGPKARLRSFDRPWLPVFQGALDRGWSLRVKLEGKATNDFEARIAIDGRQVGPVTSSQINQNQEFAFSVDVPLAELRDHLATKIDQPLIVTVEGLPGVDRLTLANLVLQQVTNAAPTLLLRASADRFVLIDETDHLLTGDEERPYSALKDPEEGFWIGTGKWRLRLEATWSLDHFGTLAGDIDGTPSAMLSSTPRFVEVHGRSSPWFPLDAMSVRSFGGEDIPTLHLSRANLILDTMVAALTGAVPAGGRSIEGWVRGGQPLNALLPEGAPELELTWELPFELRLRDPSFFLERFQREQAAVAIDFGTSSTVAAFQGLKTPPSLLRLGVPSPSASGAAARAPAENPTMLLVKRAEPLWKAMGQSERFPDLTDIVQGSHAAREKMADFASSIIAEIKSLPGRITTQDLSPQFEEYGDRGERGGIFLLDRDRIYALIQAYAYLLGRALNRPGQPCFLDYRMTFPARFDDEADRAALQDAFRKGIVRSLPLAISEHRVRVEVAWTEPEAYAACVCPEIALLPEVAPWIADGRLRFAVFDFGGGTLDIACGCYREATEEEENLHGWNQVIETYQVTGDTSLGGDHLTHELAWLVFRDPAHFPELEQHDVPMARPSTVAEDRLASKPALTARASAKGRANKHAIQRIFDLEVFKQGPRERGIAAKPPFDLRSVDGVAVTIKSFADNRGGVKGALDQRMRERVEAGVRLLATTVTSTAWGGEPPLPGRTFAQVLEEKNVMVLLAGNSSYSGYVAAALAGALEREALTVWSGPADGSRLEGFVRFERRRDNEAAITPKTAVALGALRIANGQVAIKRGDQGFRFFVGTLGGLGAVFKPLLLGGSAIGARCAAFRWAVGRKLYLAREFQPGMTSADPRLQPIVVHSDDAVGNIVLKVKSPDEFDLCFEPDGGGRPWVQTIQCTKHLA